jgi:predicted MPP superfamily phosphohydrolase
VPLAVAGRNTTRELLLLAHQPKHSDAAAAAGAGLMVCGHTHGGQMLPVIPFAGAANNGLVAGLYTYTRSPTDGSNPQALRVYVSRGTFQWGPVFRHINKHEVTVIVLERA